VVGVFNTTSLLRSELDLRDVQKDELALHNLDSRQLTTPN